MVCVCGLTTTNKGADRYMCCFSVRRGGLSRSPEGLPYHVQQHTQQQSVYNTSRKCWGCCGGEAARRRPQGRPGRHSWDTQELRPRRPKVDAARTGFLPGVARKGVGPKRQSRRALSSLPWCWFVGEWVYESAYVSTTTMLTANTSTSINSNTTQQHKQSQQAKTMKKRNTTATQ